MRFRFLVCVVALACTGLGLVRAQSLSDLVAAEEARRKRDFPAAIAVLERILRDNPYNGTHWFSLATACYESKNFRRGAEAYAEAYRLGVLKGISAYNAACCLVMDRQVEPSLDWLERAVQAGYRNFQNIVNDEDLVSLRAHSRFKQLIPPETTTITDRVAGWRFDLDILRDRLLKVHVNLATRPDRPRVEAEIERLKTEVPNLSDPAVNLRAARIVASVGDGHTRLAIGYRSKGFRRVPLLFEWFKDGIAVGMAGPDLKDLLGKKLVAIEGVPAKEVFDRLSPYVSKDNPMGARADVPALMSVADALLEIGAAKNLEEIEFEFEGSLKRRLKTAAYAEANPTVALSSLTEGENPLYLQKPSDPYWFTVLAEPKTLYFQYNEVANKPEETFAAFCVRMFQVLDEQKLERLVIDLRWNGGGNNGLIWPLIYGIIQRPSLNQTGKVFVIAGRHTFSAAQNCATNLDLHTAALFVGEPTGASPNHPGETGRFVLPYSRLPGSISWLYWQDSSPQDTRIWIAPDMVAERTVEDVRLHRDPALDAILNAIGAGR